MTRGRAQFHIIVMNVSRDLSDCHNKHFYLSLILIIDTYVFVGEFPNRNEELKMVRFDGAQDGVGESRGEGHRSAIVDQLETRRRA